MLQSLYSYSTSDTANQRLARAVYSNMRHTPLWLAVSGLGFIAISLLAGLGILGEGAPQLLYIGGITLLFAFAGLPVLGLARRERGIAASLYSSALAGTYAVLLTLLWQGIAPAAILVALFPPALAIRNGLPRKSLAGLSLLTLGVISGILYVNVAAPVERLQNNTSAAFSSIVFLISTGTLLATITFVSENTRFRSLRSQLLTSFVIIVSIPTVTTAVFSAIGTYTNSQAQTFSTLEAIAALKVNQIESLLQDSQHDTQKLLEDPRFRASALELLSRPERTSAEQEGPGQVARSRITEVLGGEEEAYSEVMVLDTRGNIILSTLPGSEGLNLEKRTFFEEGLKGFFAQIADEAAFRGENLIIAAPVLDSSSNVVRGALVLRSSAAPFRRILENTPGFNNIKTYLLDVNSSLVTQARPGENVQATAPRGTSGLANSYLNDQGQQVFGFDERISSMQLAVMAEVPAEFVFRSSLQSLAGSALLALFVGVAAITAVIISARTISDPIQALVETTESFAAGKLSARTVLDRGDEIGALAQAYNQMATQLQEMIGRLEQRVTDRTRDLERQTLRLRVAAEIARDAASARDLQELLRRAVELISRRFGFSRVDIFLLDKEAKYAVRVASSVEADKTTLTDAHRLRVGEPGTVGRAAATGVPQLSLHANRATPLPQPDELTGASSEMSLPLRVESKVIGLLHVQSNEAQAFNDDDVAIMQVLADQLATAMERTRLLQELEANFQELESAYGRFTRGNWNRISTDPFTAIRGYHFNNRRLEPISELPEVANTSLESEANTSGPASPPGQDKQPRIALPIKLRGETIGMISLKLREGYDRNTISVVELAAERLAVAMESARLYEEARLRADREESISRVTTAISASTEYEQILQTTVREVGKILGDAEVAIQILEEPSVENQPVRSAG